MLKIADHPTLNYRGGIPSHKNKMIEYFQNGRTSFRKFLKMGKKFPYLTYLLRLFQILPHNQENNSS